MAAEAEAAQSTTYAFSDGRNEDRSAKEQASAEVVLTSTVEPSTDTAKANFDAECSACE